jgi:hypothetical protein
MIIMFAGRAIGYMIAHSSTEAEFIAASDTGKMILFYRSLLEELNLP